MSTRKNFILLEYTLGGVSTDNVRIFKGVGMENGFGRLTGLRFLSDTGAYTDIHFNVDAESILLVNFDENSIITDYCITDYRTNPNITDWTLTDVIENICSGDGFHGADWEPLYQ